MTKEIGDIIAAYKEACQQGRQTALATVVHVEGSSYRRPGARMLVEDNGRLTGAISGGCLEGDALREALLAINQNQNKIVTYNTLDDDDVTFGVQLGCNGIVHILFEPIDPQRKDNPIALLERSLHQRKNAVVVTLFSLENIHGPQTGTCLFFDGETVIDNIADRSIAEAIRTDAALALERKMSQLTTYNEQTTFIELLEPPVSLILVGAGNDAFPMVQMASVLGWKITVVDGRSTHANRQRFPKVHALIVGKPELVVPQLTIDDRTVFVLMTHNYNYDLAMVPLLLQHECVYVGILGPKKRLDRILTSLEENGLAVTDAQKAMLFGPTGLDIGAEAAEEIALSILAEIKAVLAGRKGASLRDRQERIHSDALPLAKQQQASNAK